MYSALFLLGRFVQAELARHGRVLRIVLLNEAPHAFDLLMGVLGWQASILRQPVGCRFLNAFLLFREIHSWGHIVPIVACGNTRNKAITTGVVLVGCL